MTAIDPVAEPLADISWDTDTGALLFDGAPAVVFRPEQTLQPVYEMLSEEYSPELLDSFIVRLASDKAEQSWVEARRATGDAEPKAVLETYVRRLRAAGWGSVTIERFDPAAGEFDLLVENAFELRMQSSVKPSARRGIPMMKGKLLGSLQAGCGQTLRVEETLISHEPRSLVRLRFLPSGETPEEAFLRQFRARMSDKDRALANRVERRTTALRQAKLRLTHHADNLGNIVRARTAELEDALEQVESEHQERRRVEAELGERQKLQALGQLSAGVAHEINTPVQFVGDSLHFLRRSFDEILVSMQRIASIAEELPDDLGAPIAAELEELDLEYLTERVPKALDRATDGIRRVGTIVSAMKEFVHPDHTGMADADLNKAIETTLVIAMSSYKYQADVITDFGDIPGVPCQIGEINQVILNLVSNAADAIGERRRESDPMGTITIATRLVDDHVVVTVQDDGGGIPEEVQRSMFDPFFTTKDVGVGTGQGLAISRAIVDRHQGRLSVDSQIGVGSTFTLALPVTQTGEIDDR